VNKDEIRLTSKAGFDKVFKKIVILFGGGVHIHSESAYER
jgi:hypothetical protein